MKLILNYRYTGPRGKKEPAIAFIKQMFEEANTDPHRKVYTHNTIATDTKNVKFIFAAVKDTIYEEMKTQLGPIF